MRFCVLCMEISMFYFQILQTMICCTVLLQASYHCIPNRISHYDGCSKVAGMNTHQWRIVSAMGAPAGGTHTHGRIHMEPGSLGTLYLV